MIKPLSCKFGFSQQTIVSILTGAYWCKLRQGSRFEFHLWVETLILYQSLKVPKLSHYKMMVLNLHRIAENDNMILLQNEALFLSWGYLKGKIHHYKMKICFYHQVTWRGHPTTTKWRFVFIYFYHQVTWRERFNTTKWRLEMVGKGFHMLPSEGQLPLLRNDFRFLNVFQLPKRWILINAILKLWVQNAWPIPIFSS